MKRCHGLKRSGNPGAGQPMQTSGELTIIAPERVHRMLPADVIHGDEVVILLLRPHPLYIVLDSLGSLMFIAIMTLLLALMAVKLPWVGWSDSAALVFGAGLVALRLSWQTADWWNQVYVLTDRRIIRRMGVLGVALFETQLKNIQHTGVFRRLRERVFGLGSIGFATAGSDSFEAFWLMIGRPFAVHRIIVQAIRKYGRQ
jgi:hypothetical protein